MAPPRSTTESPRSAVASRRERPAEPALSRESIIGAAVAVLRAEGLEKRLAQQLDTGPASLYAYVTDATDLHGSVLDELLGKVDLEAGPGGADWRERVAGVLTSYIGVLLAHPALARSAVTARPSGKNYLRLLERLLALLDAVGVPPERAAWRWASCSRSPPPPRPSIPAAARRPALVPNGMPWPGRCRAAFTRCPSGTGGTGFPA